MFPEVGKDYFAGEAIGYLEIFPKSETWVLFLKLLQVKLKQRLFILSL